MSRGCTLVFAIALPRGFCYATPLLYIGRSSGSPALLITFPSRSPGTVVLMLHQKGSLFLCCEKSGVTAAGPHSLSLPISARHEFPF